MAVYVTILNAYIGLSCHAHAIPVPGVVNFSLKSLAAAVGVRRRPTTALLFYTCHS